MHSDVEEAIEHKPKSYRNNLYDCQAWVEFPASLVLTDLEVSKPSIEESNKDAKDEWKQRDNPLPEIVLKREFCSKYHGLSLGGTCSDCNEDTDVHECYHIA